MNIKMKIAGLIVITLVFYSFFLLLIQYGIWNREISTVEKEMAVKDMNKTISIITEEEKHLAATTADYATWDDTYNFANDKNTAYISDNYKDSSLDNLKVSLVAIFDKKFDMIYGKNKNEEGQWVDIAENELGRRLDSKKHLENGSSGIIEIYGKIYIFAAKPIMSSSGQEGSNGTFVFAKTISSVMNEDIKQLIGVNVLIHEVINMRSKERRQTEEIVSNADKKTLFIKNNDGNIALRLENRSKIDSFKIITDIEGKPAAYIQVSTARQMNLLWLKIQYFIWIALFIVGIPTAFIIEKLFNGIISKPLRVLSKSLEHFNPEKIEEDNDVMRLAIKNDEIGSLIISFEKMKQNIINKHKNIKELNETLEKKVKDRTVELELANKELMFSERILRETTDGVCITDIDGHLLKVNDAFCTMSGFERHEVIGEKPRILKSNKHDGIFYNEMWAQILQNGHWSGEIWNRRKNGELYPIWLSINAIKNKFHNVTNYIGISSDITKIKQAEENIKHLAYYDSLTGLANRILFNEILDRAIIRAAKYNKIAVLLFLDLDKFKNVNDTLGHTTGDHVLVEVAKRIQSIVKKSDTVARLGGDEFTIILEEIDPKQELTMIANRIITDLSKPINITDSSITLGVSIGIAITPNDDNTREGLVMKADAAMYYSKELGRGRFTFYCKEIERRNQEFWDMEQKIRKALEKNEFLVYLQPKVSISGNNKYIAGAEALIRMKPEGENIIMPDRFIKIAEETGLIVPMGKWVVEEACRQVAVLKKKDINIHIAVNISVKQFENRDIVCVLKNAIEQNNIFPNNIEIEITESVFHSNIEKITEILCEIRELGVKIGIDDFGTGFSSLSSLGNLPIDYLKIDKSFVDKIGKEEEKELVSTILSMAKTLSLNTVIEGVETNEQLEILCANESMVIQGYCFSKPLEFSKFVEFFESFS